MGSAGLLPPSVSCMTRGRGSPLLKGRGLFSREHQCENKYTQSRFPGPAKTQSKRKSGSRFSGGCLGWRSAAGGRLGVERQDSTRSGHTPSLSSCLRLICFLSPETGTSTAHRLLPPNFMGEWPCQMGTEALPSPGTRGKSWLMEGESWKPSPHLHVRPLLSPSSPPPQRHSRDFSLLESHASSLPRAKMSSQWCAGTVGHGLGKQGCWYRCFDRAGLQSRCQGTCVGTPEGKGSPLSSPAPDTAPAYSRCSVHVE